MDQNNALVRQFWFTSTAILGCVDGLIAAAWDEVDMLGLLSQIGGAAQPE